MAYTITSECIACDRCATICPNGAIQKNDSYQYQISSDRCNNCATTHSVPQCWAICPTNAACTPRLFLPTALGHANNDYWERWFSTYEQAVAHLRETHPSDYWGHWFGQYAKRVSHLLQSRQEAIAS